MNAGDKIALAAIVISVIAAGISIHQAKTAKESAESAKEQSAAAIEANRLTREQIDREAAKEQQEAAEAKQAAQREAEKVQIKLSGNGGSLAVQITNHGMRAVTDVQLVNVTPEEAGPWRSWKPNANVGRQLSTTSWPLLYPESDVTVAVWLLDENGTHVPQLPSRAAVEICFRDGDGQWWSYVTGGGTTRIDPPTSTT
ncbi:hypothetical protein ABT269_20845 [Streptomyces viridosporus]|uniref:hypothetical protein n=1 Tax=Streptomyces viridosporus TaxID=67581 RepID=UPI00332E3E8F